MHRDPFLNFICPDKSVFAHSRSSDQYDIDVLCYTLPSETETPHHQTNPTNPGTQTPLIQNRQSETVVGNGYSVSRIH